MPCGREKLKPNLTANGVTQMLRKKGLATGVDVRAHAFRRWHASRWLAAGGSETGLMADSGWTSSAMVGRYTRDAKEQNAQLEAARLFG
jgi:integrase/recombinase XerD